MEAGGERVASGDHGQRVPLFHDLLSPTESIMLIAKLGEIERGPGRVAGGGSFKASIFRLVAAILAFITKILSSASCKTAAVPCQKPQTNFDTGRRGNGWGSSRSATHERAEAARSTGRLSLRQRRAASKKKRRLFCRLQNGKRTQA
jgi:hypothetical protein